jgi:hypothetical protein
VIGSTQRMRRGEGKKMQQDDLNRRRRPDSRAGLAASAPRRKVRPAAELLAQLPAAPPAPTPQQIAAFLAYEIPFEVESAAGFHFPVGVTS